MVASVPVTLGVIGGLEYLLHDVSTVLARILQFPIAVAFLLNWVRTCTTSTCPNCGNAFGDGPSFNGPFASRCRSCGIRFGAPIEVPPEVPVLTGPSSAPPTPYRTSSEQENH